MKTNMKIDDNRKPDLGMKVVLTDIFGQKAIFRNVTETHFNYENSGRTAFESNIHGTGNTMRNSDIKEFEIVPETEIWSGF